eukprot:CAMPEP_0114275624 /NCGR_PEP_ID=MMETSP0058-20121206/30433_1 /TAXON_ID=36894 /ORGANISM="Pyramimonas parkeae, CCMP726" /LENGTH=158 /DNA_ID=CAMNT_0001395565 /DNA_START=155 /DNA_END=631 /DNA_ORIENTATION=+
MPMTSASPVNISLKLSCVGSKWACFKDLSVGGGARDDQWWEGAADTEQAEWVRVTQEYSQSVDDGHCGGVPNATTVVRNEFAEAEVFAQVCYSKTGTDGVTVVIPFNNSLAYDIKNVFLDVLVQSVDSDPTDTSMQVQMSMEPHQVKTGVMVGSVLCN